MSNGSSHRWCSRIDIEPILYVFRFTFFACVRSIWLRIEAAPPCLPRLAYNTGATRGGLPLLHRPVRSDGYRCYENSLCRDGPLGRLGGAVGQHDAISNTATTPQIPRPFGRLRAGCSSSEGQSESSGHCTSVSGLHVRHTLR